MKDEENKMEHAAPEQQPKPEEPQAEKPEQQAEQPVDAATAAQDAPAPEQQADAPETGDQPAPETAAEAAPKKKRPLWMKLLAVFAAALAALVLLAFLYINGKLDLIHYDDGTVDSVGTIGAEEDQDLDTTGLEQATSDEMEMPEGSPFQDDDVLNILLISTDERTDAVNDWDAFTHLNELDGTKATTEFSSDARADSLILCSLNIREDTIKLVSIERGTGVPILLDGYEGQYDWITHTFRYGGARLTMDTVEDCFNVQVDHYVRFNFNSFVQIVDAVGGIDLNLTEDEAKALNWEVPSNSMLIVNKVDPGWNHFDGYTALQYARLRAIDDDWHRVARQRTVIQAVLDQIKNASVTELNDLLDAALPVVQTNFTKTEIAALVMQLPGFLGVTADQMTLPIQGTYGVRNGMDDRPMMDPDWRANIAVLQNFLYTDMTAEEAIAAGTATPETADEEVPAETEETPVKETDPVTAYLQDNTTPVYWDYPLEDADFGNADYRVFLAGADRGKQQNIAVRKALFQYLHEQQGVNVQLVETGVGETQVLEQYLRTGDENWLNHYLKTQGRYADEEAEYWRWLWQYNRQQGGDIHVAGVDMEHNTTISMYGLLALADMETEPAESIADFVQALQDEDMTTALRLFKTAMQQQPDAMASYFGDAYAQVQQLYSNLQVNTTYAGDTDKRDLAMMDNMNFVLGQYPEEKFFAQMGNGHVTQSAWQDGNFTADYRRFGMLLNGEGSAVQGEVCSILTIYTTRGSSGLMGDDAANDYYDLTTLTEAVGKEFIATGADLLLSLDGEDTPYAEQSDVIRADNQAEELPLLNYCQKLLVLFDAKN